MGNLQLLSQPVSFSLLGSLLLPIWSVFSALSLWFFCSSPCIVTFFPSIWLAGKFFAVSATWEAQKLTGCCSVTQ